jgi:hypothetical protein
LHKFNRFLNLNIFSHKFDRYLQNLKGFICKQKHASLIMGNQESVPIDNSFDIEKGTSGNGGIIPGLTQTTGTESNATTAVNTFSQGNITLKLSHIP